MPSSSSKSSPQRKRKHVVDLVDNDEDAIRWGAMEVVAVYLGKEEEGDGDDGEKDKKEDPKNKKGGSKDKKDDSKNKKGDSKNKKGDSKDKKDDSKDKKDDSKEKKKQDDDGEKEKDKDKKQQDEEEEEEEEYGFVRLAEDILFRDTAPPASGDDEMGIVEWFERDDEIKNKDIYWPEDTTETTVPIGAIVCAAQVVERLDGSIQVPAAVRELVEKKLAEQLSDDRDPASTEDEPSFEVRLKKRQKQQKRLARSAAKASKREHESDDDDDSDDGGGKPSSRKKRKKTTPTKKKKTPTTKKGKKIRLQPRPQVKLQPDVWMSKSNKISTFNGDTYRSSKEVIRAVRTGNKSLLKKLIQDKKTVADLYVEQSVSVSLHSVEYAFAKQDKDAMELLFEASNKVDDNNSNSNRANFPECSLVEKTSGQHTSRYADYNRYQVAASRGGKEGNNAFMKENRGKSYSFPLGDRGLLGQLFIDHDAMSIDFLNFLGAKLFKNQLFLWDFPLPDLLRSGHRELTELAMRELVTKGVGLNQLHADVLSGSDDNTTLEKPRAISVVKKSSAMNNGARFCPVHCAATNPNPTYLQQLLEVAPDALSCLDSHEAGLLHYAAVSEGTGTLKWLLESFPSLSRDAKTRRPKEIALMWAARAARPDNVRLLCEGVPEDELSKHLAALNASGLTVLHIAVSSLRAARYDTVRALFAAAGDGVAKADVRGDTRLTDKVTPAVIAARSGDLEMLKLLVEHGADLTQTDKLDRSLAVWAAMNGHIHVLSYLLREGVDVEVADSSDNTPLHYAAAYGWVECLELLLAHADPDPRNSWSSTPLSLSLKKGAFACAAVLLKLKDKVDVNVCDRTGRSLFSSLVGIYLSQLSSKKDAPLPWAIQQMLDREDLDLTLADSQKRTVLHFIAASQSSNLPVVQDLVSQLLARGCDPLEMDDTGDVPASLALRNGNLEFARPLLDHVSHSDVQLSKGTSLLHLLIHQLRDCSGAELFLHIYDVLRGTWEDVVDGQGRTPLLLAVDLLRGAGCQEADDPKWCRAKEVFEALVEKMPSNVTDTLQRTAEFSDWKRVEKRIQDADGKVNWAHQDEYSSSSLECCSLFHGLCLLRDAEWALQMCRKLMKQVKNKARLGELLNLKLAEGRFPLLMVVGRVNALRRPEEQKPVLDLLDLLRENGANMDGVPHPAFDTLAEALDHDDVDAEIVQPDTSHGSDEEKLDRVYKFVLHRERASVLNKLAKATKNNWPLDVKQALLPHLHHVVQSSTSIGLLKSLLLHSDPDCRDLDGNTVLHIAVEKGMAGWTTVILERADVNAVNAKGDTALTIAAKDGRLHLVKVLLDAGAKLAHCSPTNGTALHLAVLGEHSGLVEFLLTRATVRDVNACDAQKRTPLHCAIAMAAVSSKQELKPIEDQLLAAGAEINAEDIHGRTPLSYAFVRLTTDMNCAFPHGMLKHDPIEMLSKLCSLDGIRLDIPDAQKRTSLHLAAAVGASVCVLSLTESNKDLMNAVDMDGNTPLAVALLAKRWDTALLLISKGSSLDVDVTHVRRAREKNALVEKWRKKQSTLWHAIQARGALSTYMLSAGRLPLGTVLSTLLVTGSFQKALQQIQKCRDNKLICAASKHDGMNALHRLAQAPSFTGAAGFDVALADALIDAGIEINYACKRGLTALHVAAFHGHTNLAVHLLSRGAVVDVKDGEGGTPVSSQFAGTGISAEMLRILLDASKDAAAITGSAVKGTRDPKDDEMWRSLADPRNRLFDTSEVNRRSKEALVDRLAKEASRSKDPSMSAENQPHKNRTVASTPLVEAVRRRILSTVNVLLSYGADPGGCDEDGRVGLHHASMVSSPDVLSLLLRYSADSINVCDKHGFSPVAYIVLRMLQNPDLSTSDLDMLLDYGADPQAGGALQIAVRSNRMDIVLPMLQCAKSKLQAAPKQKKKGATRFKTGDVVWTRFGGIRGSWQVTTIVKVENQVVAVVPGKVKVVNDQSGHRFTSTERVHPSWICAIDQDRDVPVPSYGELVKHFDNSSTTSEAQRMELLKQRTGVEYTLLEKMDKSHPSVQCVLSAELKAGDLVGKFVEAHCLLQIGVVVAAHPNGLCDVQLLRGRLYKQVKRTQLRTLRKELKLECSKIQIKPLDPMVVRACVRPFHFGSYENMDMLRALADANVVLDGKGDDGRTALDLARPGSTTQAFLRDATKQPEGGRFQEEAAQRGPPPLDGIDLDKDADAALKALHDEGADATERIVPSVSHVCQLESDGVCVVADEESDDYYDVSLTKVNVQHGRYGLYEFYKMQVVHDPVQQLYVLLTNWGRIGESGKHQQTPFSSKEACAKEFAKVFRSKTGNVWADRRESFEKKPNKYSLVERKRTRVKNPEKLLAAVVEEPSHPCPLEPSLAETLRSLLDVELLQSALQNSGLDQSQLPLGQLSLDTLDKAELKLREIKLKLDETDDNSTGDVDKVRSKLESVAKLTSEFYELLPAGDQVVQPFSGKNDHRFKQAVELVRVLRDLNVTKQLLLGAMHRQTMLNPVEYCYKALRVLMEPVELGVERESIQRYIDSTCTDRVVVNQIYRLDNGEDVHGDIGNKRLLFHGSKSANVLGILKQGLRIAPPEAPTTGYMYGKGVYFADQFSKAFGYTSGVALNGKKSRRAYVFLAEVALGVPHVALEAEYMEEPRSGTHSTFAPGHKRPDQAFDLTLDHTGTTVPLGSLVTNKLEEGAKWKEARSWYNSISDKDSQEIERVRNDPNTKFPARVNIQISKNNRKVDYVVLLENGPFSVEATATQVVKESEQQNTAPEEKDNDLSDLFGGNSSDDNINEEVLKLKRHSQTRSRRGYSEFIVYDTKQIRLKYLIELTSPESVKREFERQQKKASERSQQL